MIDLSFTSLVFAAGLAAGVTLDLLLLRTLLAPPFRIWPTPEPGSWQSLTFWGLFRGGMVLTFVVAVLDWNSTPLLDWTRFIPGLPLGLIGLFITVCGYFNLGLGNTYCGADGLVTGGLYRFSRNPQYTASIIGLVGLCIGANSIFTIVLSTVMVGAYVMMALVEEDWLKQLYACRIATIAGRPPASSTFKASSLLSGESPCAKRAEQRFGIRHGRAQAWVSN
jgi:protein-S-isoprenylcysteine O-methyltransferase Ste14